MVATRNLKWITESIGKTSFRCIMECKIIWNNSMDKQSCIITIFYVLSLSFRLNDLEEKISMIYKPSSAVVYSKEIYQQRQKSANFSDKSIFIRLLQGH